MNKKYCLIIVACFIFLNTVIIQAQGDIQSDRTKTQKAIQLKIEDFAKKLEVLPLDVVAYPDPDKSSLGKSFRADLTFEDYKVFYEFRKYVQNLSQEEVFASTDLLDEAKPKERGLLLMLFYLAEQMRRPEFRPHPRTFAALYPDSLQPWNDVSNEQWDKLAEAIKRYENDTHEAFPAITDSKKLRFMNSNEFIKREMELTKEYSTVLEKLGAELSRREQLHAILTREKLNSFRKNPDVPQETLDEAIVLFEYIVSIKQGGPHGVLIPYNSSAESKTVGVIARSLLKTREYLLSIAERVKQRQAKENGFSPLTIAHNR